MKHHYRSSSIVSEEKYLQNIWKICVNNNTLIPAKRLKEETNGNVITITNLSTIKYFGHEFPVNSPESKLDGLSDRMTPDNIMHSENICLSNKCMIDFEVIKIVPVKKCINDKITRSEREL